MPTPRTTPSKPFYAADFLPILGRIYLCAALLFVGWVWRGVSDREYNQRLFDSAADQLGQAKVLDAQSEQRLSAAVLVLRRAAVLKAEAVRAVEEAKAALSGNVQDDDMPTPDAEPEPAAAVPYHDEI